MEEERDPLDRIRTRVRRMGLVEWCRLPIVLVELWHPLFLLLVVAPSRSRLTVAYLFRWTIQKFCL